MFFKLFLILVTINASVCDESDIDSVINMLLSGENGDYGQPNEIENGVEPILSGGVWKCGNCDNLDESKLMYTEVNDVDDNMMTDASVDIQIGFSLPGMQCVTVQSNTVGVVRQVSGACTSDTVTLSIAPAAQFTVHVYN